jgi:hypothetical protein
MWDLIIEGEMPAGRRERHVKKRRISKIIPICLKTMMKKPDLNRSSDGAIDWMEDQGNAFRIQPMGNWPVLDEESNLQCRELHNPANELLCEEIIVHFRQ